jgi:hypothetical protein
MFSNSLKKKKNGKCLRFWEKEKKYMSITPNRRKQLAYERNREKRFHDEIEKLERDNTRVASASTSYPSHKINLDHHFAPPQQDYSYSSSSAPRSDTTFSPFRSPNNNNNLNSGYYRSPLEFQGQHVSFLPPHVVETLRPYYSRAAEAMPVRDEKDGRPRPPSFVYAPKYIDSKNFPLQNQYQDFSDPSLGGFGVRPTNSSSSPNRNNNSNSNNTSGNFKSGGYPAPPSSSRPNNNMMSTQNYGDERGNIATSTQTQYDPNANVSFVDISASNAVLQRRVDRLEQQLEEAIEQKEKMNQIIRSMSYAIVPPLAFLPKEFYEKHKSVIDTCSDYAMLYRTALRATPNVGGDLDAFEKKLEELSKEHLMDRVVLLTSEVMNLRKLVADMDRVNALSP